MSNSRRVYLISKYLVLLIPALWLIYSAFVVDVEYFDGYDAIINSYYFSGDTSLYIAYKAPLMGLILVPAHLLSQFFDLNPLDLRIYHFEIALLHIAYLIAVYMIMEKRAGKTFTVLISFVTAMLSFVFFSYSSFLSIDIFPGLFFILMIILAERFIREIKISYWITLVILGALAALVKPTYGIFWLAIIIAQVVLLVFSKEWNFKNWRSCLFLIAGSFLSFILYWIVMCFVLENSFPQVSLLMKPLEQIRKMTVDSPYHFNNWWVYIRNFPFYGLLTTLLIIPGIIMGVRSKDKFYKMIAICWLVSFVILQFLFLREVRYMAFLAPLSAFLLIHPMKIIVKNRRYLALVLLLLFVDISLSTHEALRISGDFYQKSQLKQLLNVVTESRTDDQAVSGSFTMNTFLCFIPSGNIVFVGDRFHRKFHFGPYHMKVLYCPQQRIKWGTGQSDFRGNLTYQPFSYLFYSTLLPVNSNSFWGNKKSDSSKYILFSAASKPINLLNEQSKISRVPAGNIIIERNGIEEVLGDFIFPVLLDLRNKRKFFISQTGKRKIEIEESQNLDLTVVSKSDYKFMGYRILCYININSDGGTNVNANIKKVLNDNSR